MAGILTARLGLLVPQTEGRGDAFALPVDDSGLWPVGQRYFHSRAGPDRHLKRQCSMLYEALA